MKAAKFRKRLNVLVIGYFSLVPFVSAEDSYSPYINQNYLTNVYWGDTHLHTNLSLDVYALGYRKLGPEEAYRFAKGEQITANKGMKARLRRPLDFLVVADHAENMGVLKGLDAENPDFIKSAKGRLLSSRLKEINRIEKSDINQWAGLTTRLYVDGFLNWGEPSNDYRRSIWKNVTGLADKHNEPGKFTALIGYEWTQALYNLHRVVIFKDDAQKVGQVIPFSRYDSDDPEDLWAYMSEYESTTGGEVLAIPHNGNFSKGIMFAEEDAKGNPLSRDYAKMRSRWEPLYEVTQTKGNSESHPLLSPTDEFSDSELISLNSYAYQDWKKKNNLTYYDSWIKKNIKKEDTDWMRTYEYARSALKLGLKQQVILGVNPFKFGMIGSTDSHTALTAADENNFFGTEADPHSKRITGPWLPGTLQGPPGWKMNASGYAAVWAKENTREALFAAMKRKETYATTGPRMRVRFFGGWNYKADDAFHPNLAGIGYSKGVPMGGDLSNAPDGTLPSFLIRAVKDPDGANLDRVQVIKGWHDKQGALHEKIYNVALSDGRRESRKGKIEPVGNTVDVKDASYNNSIGDPELSVVWQDPDFHKDELAFYYVRVLEIPTPRWTAYDAKYFGLKDIPEEVPMVTQERAYTSPIWYTPAGT